MHKSNQKGAVLKHLIRLIPIPRRNALRVLQIEFPVILLWAVTLLVSFLEDYQADPVGAAYRYPERLEYITVSILISVATAILVDLVEREQSP